MQDNKETEIKRAEYYKKKLKNVKVLYESSIQIQEDIKPLSTSMVGEFVLSPFLILFTIWVLKSAIRDNVKRLYFLARDGYPAYKMACKLCEEYEIEIECRYLYCSRYSLRVPMYSENIEEMLEYVCRSGIDVSWRKILRRAGLRETEIVRLEQNKLGEKQLCDSFSYSQLEKIKKVLREDTEFLQLVIANSRVQWDSLSNYFLQEGLADNLHIGLVDSGWIGSTQKSVSEILKRMGNMANLDGYYWGLYDVPDDMETNRYHSFLFDKKHGLKNKLFFSNCLIETVFSNTHGTTISYARKMGKVVPILQENYSNEEFIIKFNRLLEQYSENFVNVCSKERFEQFNIQESTKLLTKTLLKFMYFPTTEEAEFFGSLHFSDDLLDDNIRELGPVFTLNELKENHFLNRILNVIGKKHTFIHESAWFSGTVRRSTNNIIWHDCSYLVYRLLSYLKKSF